MVKIFIWIAAGIATLAFLVLVDIPTEHVPPMEYARQSTPPGLFEDFSRDRTITEAPNPDASKDDVWWVDSGGEFDVHDGTGSTLLGALNEDSPWYALYRQTTETVSGGGKYPQNVFRLLTRETWRDHETELRFRISEYRTADAASRSESNGVLIFSRYEDADTLYYGGVRVDGTAVIKKKIRGDYYTLAFHPVWTDASYDREATPNLIPVDTWLALKLRTVNFPDQTVVLELFLRTDGTDSWQRIAAAFDDGVSHGGNALTAHGRAGIRTDFMDVEFDEFGVLPVETEIP